MPTPPTAEPRITHEEFLQRALTAAGEWSRFADPKVLGVFVFLGLGMADLIQVAGALWEARDENNVAGWLATGGFVMACLLAVLAVLLASVALFPQLRPGGHAATQHPRSLFYFGQVGDFDTAADYEQAVLGKTSDELRSDLAGQAWAVARVAARKHRYARRAYVSAVLFLVSWAASRIGLSFL
jgi:Family of unknown function (DUF5706)